MTYGSIEQTKEQDKAFPSPFGSALSRKKREREPRERVKAKQGKQRRKKIKKAWS